MGGGRARERNVDPSRAEGGREKRRPCALGASLAES